MTDEQKEVEELAKIIEKESLCYEAVALGLATKILNKYGYRKSHSSGLEPSDNDCAGFVLAFERRMLQKTNQGLRGEERAYLQSMIKTFCSKFGRPKTLSVEQMAKIIADTAKQSQIDVVYHNESLIIAQALRSAMDSTNDLS